MIKNTNFFVIQGWMLNELKLSGNHLMVYAIIFGFSHIENQKFTGSRRYLAEATNSTIRTIQNVLDYLVEKEFIIKEESEINNIKNCDYYANLGILDEFDCITFLGGEKFSPPVKKLHWGGEKTSPNNIDINITGKRKKEKLEKSTLNENFSVSDSMMKWAQEKFLNLDPQWIIEETENFKDYYIAKQSEWADWLRVWQKWIRKSKDKVFIEKKENPPSASPGSPPNPDFVKGTQIEKFEKNSDGTFNRKKYSKECLSYIRRNHKNLIDTAHIKRNNNREKLTEHEAMLLQLDFSEYEKHWNEVQEQKNSRK